MDTLGSRTWNMKVGPVGFQRSDGEKISLKKMASCQNTVESQGFLLGYSPEN